MRSNQKAISILVLAIVWLVSLACSISIEGDEEGSSTLTPELETTPMEMEGEIVVEDSPLRSGPGKDFEELGTIKKGESVRVIGISSDGDWYELEEPSSVDDIPDDEEVWISVLFVELQLPEGVPMPGMTPVP